jgi:transposase-like protein
MPAAGVPQWPVDRAFEEMTAGFERFCLAAGLEALGAMMEADAAALCGPRHGRGSERRAQRWGRTAGPIGFHGGKVAVARPRVRERGGKEVALPSWQAAVAEDWLGRWAMNLMLEGVTTRRFGRAVRLPEGDVPAGADSGVSKSAASRRFVALSAERLAAWLEQDLSGLDLLDDLVTRGLDPSLPRLFIIYGAKALSKAIRRTFGRDTPIQRCQVHKARNIIDRLPKHLHASTRRALRQAWELDDAEKAEKLLRNLARTLEREALGVAGAILEGLDEILTVVRLGLPKELRRSLACTNIIENIMSGAHRARAMGPVLGAPRLPQRQALARCIHGAALDRRGRRIRPALAACGEGRE